jgi:hypothetical protein
MGIDPVAIATEVKLSRFGRENAPTRALRFLVEGRLMIRHVGLDLVDACVRGDSGVLRRVTFDPSGWSCTCPARSDRCAHVLAVKTVVVVPVDPRTPPGGFAA